MSLFLNMEYSGFLNSETTVHEIISQIVNKSEELSRRRQISRLFHKTEASFTIKRQLLLVQHSKPRHDIPESRFRLLNVWKDDIEPVPLGNDSMNPYRVPSRNNFCEQNQQSQLLSLNQIDLGVVNNLILAKKLSRSPRASNNKSKQKSKPKHANINKVPKRESLMPIGVIQEVESKQILGLRDKKMCEYSLRNQSNKQTDCSFGTFGTGRRNTQNNQNQLVKEQTKKQKRPMTSATLSSTGFKSSNYRIQTAVARK